MTATFTDQDGDLYEVTKSLSGRLLTLSLNGHDEVTFLVSDTTAITELIKAAAA